MAVLSTFINAATHDYELSDGKNIFANELATETYTRIITPLGAYLFDPTFGSEIPLWINTRIKVTAYMITTAISNALQPMITAGRAISVSSTVNSITLNSINFTVSVTDTNNITFKFTIPYVNSGNQ